MRDRLVFSSLLLAGVACSAASTEPPAAVPAPLCADPGRVTLHRLNRVEYNNTVRDLLGTTRTPADDFPADDYGYGFDNNADVLSLAPQLFEKYELASEKLVEDIVGRRLEDLRRVYLANTLSPSGGAAFGASAWNLFDNLQLELVFTASVTGDYEISVRAFGQQAGPDPARMAFLIDGVTLATVDVRDAQTAGLFVQRATLTGGAHRIAVAFVNDFYDPPADRNLIVESVAVAGPIGAAPLHTRVIDCDPSDACMRSVLAKFAGRAWRRPLATDELERLLSLASSASEEDDPFHEGLRLALQAVLLSPHFLYRVELDPSPTSLEPHVLSSYELASRLSYFIWSSMPDETLAREAERGTLHEPTMLGAQVARMLADPRSDAFVQNFGGQWLGTRGLDDVIPDYRTFPAYSEPLKQSMRTETHQFLRSFIDTPRSALEMFDADFSFVDGTLATHYGLAAGVPGTFQRVELGDSVRGGLLTHASILTVTSRSTRTSPVKRGQFILEQLLCQAPPPPPPGVEGLLDLGTGATIRERMEAHRANPSCSSCHSVMDPLGFALEGFDGIGALRTLDGTATIDTSGTLPDGRTFAGARELGRLIAEDPATPHCMTNHFFTYAHGKGPENDSCSLDEITDNFAAGGFSLESLITSIATHRSFTMRRGEVE